MIRISDAFDAAVNVPTFVLAALIHRDAPIGAFQIDEREPLITARCDTMRFSLGGSPTTLTQWEAVTCTANGAHDDLAVVLLGHGYLPLRLDRRRPATVDRVRGMICK
jgi:hypothetical protein